MKNQWLLSATLAAALFLNFGAANAVEVHLDTGEIIEMDNGVVLECEKESLNLGACACVVSIMLEKEEKKSLTLKQMIRLATDYPAHYKQAKTRCQRAN